MPTKVHVSTQKNERFIEETFKNEPKVTVIIWRTYDWLVKKIDADFILRGLRNPADFEFEKQSLTRTGICLK
jgi:pantetheine-phosphate adenylyltransferase